MNRSPLIFMLLLFLSPIAAGAVSEESKRFNNLGMGLYEQGEYIEAGESFQRSLETDPTNFLAHYNLACTMALLRKEFIPQEFARNKYASFDISLETILKHLGRAAELQEYRRVRMLEDPDLLSLQNALEFHRIAGRKLTNAEDAALLLPRINWRLDYQSQYGKNAPFPAGTIRFTENGRFHAELWEENIKVSGKYSVGPGSVMLRPESNTGTAPIRAVLSERGAVLPGLGKEPLIMWNDISE